MKNESQQGARIFYGWWLMLVCLIIQSIGFGTSLYLYSVLIGAIGKEFTGSRFVMMIGVSGMFLLVGLMSPKIGSLLDRYPVKKVLLVGGIVMGSGFILMAFSGHIYHVVICYALFIAMGMTILSPLSCSLLLTRWFVRYRGLALGISALGTQLGGVMYPPIIAYFINLYGWRITVVGLGIYILVVVPVLALVFVYDHPKLKGLNADGAPNEAGDVGDTHAAHGNKGALLDQSLKHIVTSKNFIIVVAIITFMSVIYSGILSNLSLIAVDKGETLEKGAVMVSFLSLAGMISSPLMGRFSDVLSVKKVLLLLCGSVLISLVLFIQAQSYAVLAAAVICFGFFGGAVVPVWSAVLSRLYSTHIYGRVMGASSAVVYSVASLSAPAIGVLYDFSGDYQTTFYILLGAAALFALSIRGIKPAMQQAVS